LLAKTKRYSLHAIISSTLTELGLKAGQSHEQIHSLGLRLSLSPGTRAE